MKNVFRARMHVLMFSASTAAVQIYLSLYYWNYSPIIVVLGVRYYDYQLRPYVALVNCLAIAAHVVCFFMYRIVLNNNEHEELQRRLTLCYLLFGFSCAIACGVVAIVFAQDEHVLITSLCVGGLLVLSSLLCCDCWRERNDVKDEEKEERGETDPEALEQELARSRTNAAQLQSENAVLEAELKQLGKTSGRTALTVVPGALEEEEGKL